MSAVKAKHPPPTDSDKHRFGSHLSIAGGVHQAIVEALSLRLDTVQVFVKNQRQWRAPPLAPEHVERWHQLRVTPGFGPPVAHATYLINLASGDRNLAGLSRTALAQELRRCQLLAIPYLIVHPGSATGSTPTQAIRRVSQTLNRLFDGDPNVRTRLLLETTAGQGTALGRSFEELGEIIAGLQEPQRVAVCIDTCHVFAAGYDIREPQGYHAMIGAAERTVGLDRICCWHLNDSKAACGARVDRHEHIGQGQLGRAAFRSVLADPRFRHVPMILETPKGTDAAGRDLDRVNLRRLRNIEKQLEKTRAGGRTPL